MNCGGEIGFALFDDGACYLSDSYKVDRFESLTGITTANNTACGSGRGTDAALSVYSFPFAMCYSDCSEDDELTAGAIAGVQTHSLLPLYCAVIHPNDQT